MIADQNPKDWCELQAGVCRLLNEIGLASETEKPLLGASFRRCWMQPFGRNAAGPVGWILRTADS